jgi:hypothetical protein
LNTIPYQARRLIRWRARRLTLVNPKFTDPLRPGRPPGHREKPIRIVDEILRDCHSLAHYALQQDTS